MKKSGLVLDSEGLLLIFNKFKEVAYDSSLTDKEKIEIMLRKAYRLYLSMVDENYKDEEKTRRKIDEAIKENENLEKFYRIPLAADMIDEHAGIGFLRNIDKKEVDREEQ